MPLPPRRQPHSSAQAFRLLLTLYPGEFRDEYGRELALVFADRYRHASTTWERTVLWLEASWGVLVEAPKEHVHMIRQDLRYALRTFLQKPLFALTVTTTLALGVGANTAVFQLIDAVRLRSLPVEEPHELAEVRIVGGNGGFGLNDGAYGQLTRPMWRELKAHQQAFSGMFAFSQREVRIGEDTDLRRMSGLRVTGDFFRVLGVQPWRGRLIEPRDEGQACPASRAVVSHAYWQREMGGRELTGNERIRVDGDVIDVVGVTPPRFLGLAVGERFDVAYAFCEPKELRRELFNVTVMGRLRSGWTLERASAHVHALSAGIVEATAPSGYSAKSIERFKAFRFGAYPASSGVSQLRAQYDTSLWLLLAITSLVLLIACANLANLMLARAAARDREVAVRLALGASRLTLVRQLVTESGLLAIVGALAGIGLAQVLSRVLIWALSTQDGAPVLSLATNWRVLLFTAVVAAATCVVFGVAPAVRATRVQATSAMRSGGRGLTADRGRLLTQRLMVVTQIAVSLVLLVAALLFVGSFRNLMTLDTGMRQEGIVVGFFAFHKLKLPSERINDYQRELVTEIRSLPGVIGAATTTNVPLTGSSWGHGVKVGAAEGGARFTWVGPGYFETMGIPIVQGRHFTLRDTRTSPRVAIVNQTFIRRLIADAKPIGKLLTTSPEPGYPATTYEIVGVIPDTRYDSLRGETPEMVFAPDSQIPSTGPWAVMMIRSSVEPSATIGAIKQRIARARPEVISEYTVFQSRIRDGLVRERLLAMLSGFFGGLAALLAVVGLYGMMSYAVAQRQQEIGIRVALGANQASIIGMVMRDAGWLLLIGIVVGGGLSLVASRTAASLLFGLQPHDPTTIVSACTLLAAIAAVASLLPARRASKLDPLAALRQE